MTTLNTDTPPSTNATATRTLGLGIYGASGRGINVGTRMLESGTSDVRIVALCSLHETRLREAEQKLIGAMADNNHEPTLNTYTDMDAMLADPAVDIVMIASPTDSHAPAYEKAAAAGKTIVCEKPLAQNAEDCERILAAARRYRTTTMLSLTRRYESVWRQAHQIVEDGRIGNVQMLLLRSVIPFSRYFSRWHRRRKWSGGILDEKSSHHFDMLNWFAGDVPRSVYTAGGRNVFTYRPGYPSRCSQCTYQCPYRRCDYGSRNRRSANAMDDMSGQMGTDYEDDPEGRMIDDRCVWSGDNDVEDHAITTIEYANGVKANLQLCIIGNKTEDHETLEVIGDRGKLVLTRQSGQIVLDADFGNTHETIDAADENHHSAHHGADYELIRQIPLMARGEQAPAVSVEHGYLSSMMAFWAQQSMETGQAVQASPLVTAACPTIANPGLANQTPPPPNSVVGP